MPYFHNNNKMKIKQIALISITLCISSLSLSSFAVKTHGLSMFDDLKYDENFTHFEYVNPEAPKGGRLNMGSTGSFDSFNPFIRKGVTPAGMNLLGGLTYDTLMAGSDDEPFSMYGLLAHHIDLADDRTSITFYLHKHAKFHDGEPITADDVIFSLNTLKEKGNPFYQYYFAEIASAEKIDSHTVKFNLSNPDNGELPLISGQLPVLPEHYWQDKDFTRTTLEAPVSSGPYKIKDFKAGRYIVYERVSDYWGKDLPVMKGKYNFDEIKYDYYLDESVLKQALKSGKIDYRAENSAKAWAFEYNIDAVENNWLLKQKIATQTPIVSTGMGFNLRKEKFKNRVVRQAIGLAFDYEWTNKNVFYNQYLRADSYFPESEFTARGLPQKDELTLLKKYKDQLPEYVFNTPISVPKTDGSGWNRGNLKKASELLKLQGYSIVNNRLIDPQGNPLTIEFLTTSATIQRILLPFKRNLSVLGIDFQIRVIDGASYQNRVQEFDFDMAQFGAGQSLNPGNEQKDYWGSDAANTPASRNLMGISNSTVDALIKEIIKAPSRKDLITAVKSMDRVLMHEYYMIPGWHLPARRLVLWNKFGQPRDVITNITPIHYGEDAMNWWYDENKASTLEIAMKNNEKLEQVSR